jgi:hypothetical protein
MDMWECDRSSTAGELGVRSIRVNCKTGLKEVTVFISIAMKSRKKCLDFVVIVMDIGTPYSQCAERHELTWAYLPLPCVPLRIDVLKKRRNSLSYVHMLLQRTKMKTNNGHDIDR